MKLPFANNDAEGATAGREPPRSRRRLFVWIFAALAGVLVPVLFSNYYLARHREVYVVSGYGEQISVTVTGLASAQVAPGGVSMLVLPEGRHQAAIRGKGERAVAFDVPGSFWGRWFDRSVCILNPGGAAVLIWEQIGGPAPSAPGALPPVRLYYGDEFFCFTNVDYVLQNFPPSFATRPPASPKTRVGVVKANPASLVTASLRIGDADGALRVTEWALRLQPMGNSLVNVYVAVAKQSKQVARARDFLRQGLVLRPIDMGWHRAYQEMFSEEKDSRPLQAEYDALLQKEPNHSGLLYLRGRLSEEDKESLSFFERAVAADTNNAFALNAVGFRRATRGDWAAARELFARAHALQPADLQFSEYLFEARLALGELTALEQELRAAHAEKPADLDVHRRLVEVLMSAQKRNEGLQVLADFARDARQRYQRGAEPSINTLGRALLYAGGDFPGLERASAPDPSPEGREALFQALLEGGKLAEAVKHVPLDDVVSDAAWNCQILSLAWQRAGDSAQANAWRARTIELGAQGRRELRRAAALLAKTDPTPLAELLELSLSPKYKAILVVSLAQRFPAQRAELLPLARTLNADRGFPHHLVRRLCDEGLPP